MKTEFIEFFHKISSTLCCIVCLPVALTLSTYKLQQKIQQTRKYTCFPKLRSVSKICGEDSITEFPRHKTPSQSNMKLSNLSSHKRKLLFVNLAAIVHYIVFKVCFIMNIYVSHKFKMEGFSFLLCLLLVY